jgi:hypothetical protein
MKQHITVDQLNELSDKAKEKLRGWWKPEEFDLVLVRMDSVKENRHVDHIFTYSELSQVKKPEYIKKDNLPLPSIGQMIEFLDDHDFLHDGTFENGTINKFEKFNSNLSGKGEFIGWGVMYEDSKPELCDALWEAVKQVLEGI